MRRRTFTSVLVKASASIAMLVPTLVLAQPRIHIFDIRKNLPLKTGEKVYKDYYINGGLSEGLRKGMIFTVVRRVPMFDPYQNQSQGDLILPVARLKIIHSDASVAVARYHSGVSRESVPIIEYEAIMIGDRVDLASAFVEKVEIKKKVAKKSETSKKHRKPTFIGPVRPVDLKKEERLKVQRDDFSEATILPRD